MNVSAPFIHRPVATTLLATAIVLAGSAAYKQLPVAPLPRVDSPTINVGAGLPGGLGARLEHARPLAIDNLAARFPALTIIAAHPGWPWTDEMTAVALHKGNVYWELSGWAPKYFPPSLRTDIRGRLREKIMFGSDHPSLPYQRMLREWDELGYDQGVMDLVFHANAERVLGL